MDKTPLFHIVSGTLWQQAKAQGEYLPSSFKAEGFIHLSTREQIVTVANRFFRGQRGLVVLAINPALVTSAVKFESVPDSPEKYPHLYGPLNLDAVEEVRSIEPDADGTFRALAI